MRKAADGLLAAKAAIRCHEMIELLESLGFEVRAGRKQGHRIVVHHGIEGFHSAAFTCGHGRNPEIKPVYVTQMAKLLRRYEVELGEWLERKS